MDKIRARVKQKNNKVLTRVKCEKQPKGYPKENLHTQDSVYVHSSNYGL